MVKLFPILHCDLGSHGKTHPFRTSLLVYAAMLEIVWSFLQNPNQYNNTLSVSEACFTDQFLNVNIFYSFREKRQRLGMLL